VFDSVTPWEYGPTALWRHPSRSCAWGFTLPFKLRAARGNYEPDTSKRSYLPRAGMGPRFFARAVLEPSGPVRQRDCCQPLLSRISIAQRRRVVNLFESFKFCVPCTSLALNAFAQAARAVGRRSGSNRALVRPSERLDVKYLIARNAWTTRPICSSFQFRSVRPECAARSAGHAEFVHNPSARLRFGNGDSFSQYNQSRR
jgi:hypothetical protein